MSRFFPNEQPETVIAFTVATNIYFDYWKQMALSADEFLFPDSDVTLCVFTNSYDEAIKFAKSLSRVRVKPVQIEPLTWPRATIDRYALISNEISTNSAQVLMHVDADMVFALPVGSELSHTHWINGLALVRHPGFFRTRECYLRLLTHPKMLLSEIRNRIVQGSHFGSWETNRKSTAFVVRNLRRNYVCGAIWMGQLSQFAHMVQILAERVEMDAQNGIIAKWHDESHLNWFAAHHSTTLLAPEYCSTSETKWLHSLPERVIAVDKGANRTR